MAIGFVLGCFLLGLFFLSKGEVEISKTKTPRGRQVRLGGAICMLAVPLTILIALLTKPQADSVVSYSMNLLASSTGIVISVIGLVIGLVVIYLTPTTETA